jgi:hypothetical protein
MHGAPRSVTRTTRTLRMEATFGNRADQALNRAPEPSHHSLFAEMSGNMRRSRGNGKGDSDSTREALEDRIQEKAVAGSTSTTG